MRDDQTPHYHFRLPSQDNKLEEDQQRLYMSIMAIDAELYSARQTVNSVADDMQETTVHIEQQLLLQKNIVAAQLQQQNIDIQQTLSQVMRRYRNERNRSVFNICLM